jgi:Cytochrome P460
MRLRTRVLLLPLFAATSFAQTYTVDGELKLPPDYRQWVFLSSGIGMDYSKEPSAHPIFDNVFVNPPAYAEFLKTGAWPDKTMLVKENRVSSDDPLSNGGKVQTSVVSREIHIKDASHGGWLFYGYRADSQSAKPVAKQEVCTGCHSKNGATETTFVQYYPTLVEVAKQHNNFRETSAPEK